MKLYSTIFIACLIASKTFGSDIESVSYQSIPQLLTSGEIEKVEIYNSGMSDVDAVFTKKDGTAIAVEKPRGLDRDAVFQQYLNDNNVQFMVYDYEYNGDEPNKQKPVWKSSLFMILPTVLMFGTPILLILVIMKQTKTIAKQTDTIKALAEK